MKIDIEGAEVQALQGATLLGKLRRIIIEVHGNYMENVKRIHADTGTDQKFFK